MASLLVDLLDLPGLARGRRLAGLDLGEKTIGVAVCDPAWRIAAPLETVRRTRFTADAERLTEIVRAHAVGALVLGLPLNMDGSEGPRVQSAKAFARNLVARLPIPIAFWDERLSTAAVTRTLLEADASRARRASVVDKLAASFILQGAIDRLSRLETAADEGGP